MILSASWFAITTAGILRFTTAQPPAKTTVSFDTNIYGRPDMAT